MQRKLNHANAKTHTRINTQPVISQQLSPTKNNTYLNSTQKMEESQFSKEKVEQNLPIQRDKEQIFSFDMLEQLIDAIYFGQQVQKIRGLIAMAKLIQMPAAKKIINKIVSSYFLNTLFYLAKHQNNNSIRKAAIDAIYSIMVIKNQLKSIIIKKGALTLFIDHLKSNAQNQSMNKSCVKAIIGLITHSPQTRATILKLGGLNCMITLAKQQSEQQFANICYEGLSLFLFVDNFNNPKQQRFEQLKETIYVICNAVAAKRVKDQQIIQTCIRTICFYSEGNIACSDLALKTGFAYYLFEDILRRKKLKTTHMLPNIISCFKRIVQRANSHQISIILSQQLFGNHLVWENQQIILEKYQILSLIATGGHLHVQQILNNRIIVNGLKPRDIQILKQKICLFQTLAKYGQRKLVLDIFKQLAKQYIIQIEKNNPFYQIIYLQYLRVLVFTTLRLQSYEIYRLAKDLFDQISMTGKLDKWKNSNYKRSTRTIIKLMHLFD